MLGFALMLAVAVGLLLLLVWVLGSEDRYSTMSEEEYEAETRKRSLLGAAVIGLEASLRRRESAILMEAKTRVEREATQASGQPPEEPGREPPPA